MRPHRLRAAAGALALLAALGCASSRLDERKFVPDPDVVPVAEMDTSLRAVVAAQRQFHQERGTYASSLDELRGAVPVEVRPAVTVVILAADGEGWTARAAYRGRSGRNCVVYDGGVPETRRPMTDSSGATPSEAGVPACDPPAAPSPAGTGA